MSVERDGPAKLAGAPGTPNSAVAGVAWPAIPRPTGMATLAVHDQLSRSQWWPAERIEAMQSRQLALLLRHAARNVPHYRRLLAARAGQGRDAFHALPVVSRAELQAEPAAFASASVPPKHGPVSSLRSSGSTGRPVEVKVSAISALFRRALNLREVTWHARDLRLRAATIRNFRDGSGMPPQGKRAAGWCYGYATTPLDALNIRATVEEQLRWLQEVRPAYLSTFPTNLRALALEALRRKLRLPGLRQACTYAEAPPQGLGELVRRAFDCGVTDTYSSEETGPIAFQCPQGSYHVQAENLIVEVLDEADRACPPGRPGSVVVTDLHNLAMPLIRYRIGDHAEFGPPCSCGRGLPVLKRILGRTRNMLRTPAGGARWPSLPSGDELGSLAPAVRQFQLVQRDFQRFELHLVVAQPLGKSEEDRVRSAFLQDLGGEFALSIHYDEAIARSSSGKYEDFRCDMAQPESGL